MYKYGLTPPTYIINELWGGINVTTDKTKEITEDMTMITMAKCPPVYGKRVCLNPESPNYHKMISEIGCDAGYIINPVHGDNVLKSWFQHDLSTRNGVAVHILFDNKNEAKIHLRDLLPIDSKSIDVYVACMKSHSFCNTADKIYDLIDDRIFNHYDKLKELKIYDDTWRKTIYDAVKEKFPDKEFNF